MRRSNLLLGMSVQYGHAEKLNISQSGTFLLRPLVDIYSGVDRASHGPANPLITPSSRASCIDGPAGPSVLNLMSTGGCVHVFGLFAQPYMIAGLDGVRGSRPHQQEALLSA